MKKIYLAIILLITFMLGALTYYFTNLLYFTEEKPFYFGILNEKEQPSNWISEKDIRVFPDKIVINIENAGISRYADTGSMLPTLGENANGIRIKPKSAEQINIGDSVTYERAGDLIIHRVIAKGNDSKGDYFILKGDNNSENDGKVYFEEIKYITVGLIY